MAAKYTVPQAKNYIGRALRAIVDPLPSKGQITDALTFFDHRCAYCGEELQQRFHLDHLVSAGCGGSNHISNRVPACPVCNEEEKLDQPWETFLRVKAGDAFEARKARILSWCHTQAGQGCAAEHSALAERSHNEICQAIDRAVETLRKAKCVAKNKDVPHAR